MNLTGANSQTIPETKAIVIIPSRLASSRLPGKALLEIAGKPMVCWVAERARAARNVARVIVATDDLRIVDAVRSAGGEAMMTRGNHVSGTDRVAEVAATLDDAEIIVNVQGDEPLISPQTIEKAIEALVEDSLLQRRKEEGTIGGEAGRLEKAKRGEAVGIVTTWERIEALEDVLNPDVVKIVVASDGSAIYFSRAPIPYPHDAVRKHGTLAAALKNEPTLLSHFRKHTGLYVYRRDVLLEFTRWPQSELERAESLEQLRALEHGVKIKAIEASTRSLGIDSKEDLERVRKLVSSSEFRVSSSF